MNIKIAKGDKVRIKKETKWIPANVGNEFIVEDVCDNMIKCVYNDDSVEYTFAVSEDIFEEYFEKVKTNIEYDLDFDIDDETMHHIAEILSSSKFYVTNVFDKCTIVACQLPNGFVIVESSSCVDPDDYDEEIGIENCMSRIEDKVIEMEAYRSHYENMSVYNNKNIDHLYNNGACGGCCGECI